MLHRLGVPAPPGVPARWGLLVSALFGQRSQKQSECVPKARDKTLAQTASGGDPDQYEHESGKHHANAAMHLKFALHMTLNLLQIYG